MELRIVQEAEMSAGLDQAIKAGLCHCFPADREIFTKARAWHGSAPTWSVIAEDGEVIVAHVGLVDRVVKAGTRQLRVAGIQNVFVLPERRGQGLCDLVMNAAMQEAGRLGFDAGLLYCIPTLEKVYARCGWFLLPKADIIRMDEQGAEIPLPDKNIAMFHPLKVVEFPTGTIHLQGNDW